jgi:signal transduction histidine kinase
MIPDRLRVLPKIPIIGRTDAARPGTTMKLTIRAIRRKLAGKTADETFPLHVFKEFEESLNLIEDLDQIALNFLGKVREIVPADRLALFIYDQDMGRFKAAAWQGADESELKGLSFVRTDSLVKWLKVNKACFDVKGQPGVFEYLSPREKETLSSLGAELCFPIMSMNRLIGVFFMGRKPSGEGFGRQEISFISSLTPQTGIALENAILYKEQRERFRRMLRADKLATIGELAAGAAHEIRNPLTAVKSSLQYLQDKNPDETARKLLATALEETGRIEEILSGMLSFSRPSEMKKERHDLLETLRECLELISFQARKNKVAIVQAYPAAPIVLAADRSQLKQLFLNILLNAVQAMPAGGEIRVQASVPDGIKALVSVADTGEGILEENLDRIFDPFFTTKKGGTGLGLSICYGIVKSHEGEIEVKSRPGQGTTVIVKLPLEA